MPIKSYVLVPLDQKIDSLLLELGNIKGCEVQRAANKDVLVAVTDAPTETADKELFQSIEQCPSLGHVTLVSGFDE